MQVTKGGDPIWKLHTTPAITWHLILSAYGKQKLPAYLYLWLLWNRWLCPKENTDWVQLLFEPNTLRRNQVTACALLILLTIYRCVLAAQWRGLMARLEIDTWKHSWRRGLGNVLPQVALLWPDIQACNSEWHIALVKHNSHLSCDTLPGASLWIGLVMWCCMLPARNDREDCWLGTWRSWVNQCGIILWQAMHYRGCHMIYELHATSLLIMWHYLRQCIHSIVHGFNCSTW